MQKKYLRKIIKCFIILKWITNCTIYSINDFDISLKFNGSIIGHYLIFEDDEDLLNI